MQRTDKAWEPLVPVLTELRNLARYDVQLQEQKTALGNIKHRRGSSYEVQVFILKGNSKLIEQIDKHIKECVKAVEKLLASDISNAKQLSSFAGYDVVQRESGTSIKGKT